MYKGNYWNDEREGYGEMYWIDGNVQKGQWHNGIFIESKKLKMNQSYEDNIIEARIYNLPKMSKRGGNKSVIESQNCEVLPRLSQLYNSPRVTSNGVKGMRKSIEFFTPKNNTLYYSQKIQKFNNSIPRKVRNTYNGFPLRANMKPIKKKRIYRKITKNKRLNHSEINKKKMTSNISKIGKSLVADLTFYADEPIDTSDIKLNGKLFSNKFKMKAQKLLINF